MDKPLKLLNPLKILRQRGAALLLMAIVITIGAAAFTIRALNQANIQIEREKTTNQALATARAAVIGWSVSHATIPGSMPFPDRNGDGDYDGNSDCYTGAFNYSFLLGQLPWAGQTAPCQTPYTGLGIDVRDGYGNRLWYAVSRNLVRDYQNSADPIINPGMISPTNIATAPYQRLGGTTAYPWITVYDKNGGLVSDRVAVVLIAPGPVIGAQDRSAAAPSSSEYLDSFSLAAGGGIKSNTSYTAPDEDFYMSEDSRNVRSDNAAYAHPYEFNDKLVYITIDELMAEVEKRAVAEARTALTNFFAAPRNYYPRPALLGASKNYYADNTQLSGTLPINNAAQAACTCAGGATRTCTCGFDKVNSIAFTRGGAQSWTGNTGACSRNGRTCTCTGLGTCTRNAQVFSCSAVGMCTSSTNGTYTFNGTFNTHTLTCPTSTAFTCNTVSCGITNANIAAGTQSFSNVNGDPDSFNDATTNSVLPNWFTANQWQDYIYYTISSNCVSGQPCNAPTLTVGARAGIRAALIATGNSITSTPYAASTISIPNPNGLPQSRPSCNAYDYLDSVENADGDVVFDATNLPKSSSYNDRTFIVAP